MAATLDDVVNELQKIKRQLKRINAKQNYHMPALKAQLDEEDGNID